MRLTYGAGVVSKAWESILLEASIGPRSSSGTTICQGNLVAANATLKKAGNTIARSQRMVFHFSTWFLLDVFTSHVFPTLFG